MHIVQQLRFYREYGGFYLAAPKAGSVGSWELDPIVAEALRFHQKNFPIVPVDLPDLTGGRPKQGQSPPMRKAMLMFVDENGKPIHDQRWSKWWAVWRAAAGWPANATFHALRHYFATTQITQGVDATHVQQSLRHKRLRTTLEAYVHWFPKADRQRGVVGARLNRAREHRKAKPRNRLD